MVVAVPSLSLLYSLRLLLLVMVGDLIVDYFASCSLEFTSSLLGFVCVAEDGVGVGIVNANRRKREEK